MKTRRLTSTVLLLAVLTLAACQSATPAAEPTQAPTDIPVQVPTDPPEPVAEESALTPAVVVADQEVLDGAVTIASVVSDGPGWLVVHADNEGAPGPVVGYAPVGDGENQNIIVEIDLEAATETLYAMLHTDAGETGVYEFPGDDGPVKVNDQVVTPAFMVSGLEMADMEDQMMMGPSVSVEDQEIVDGAVTIARVYSDGPGWLVIHADNAGAPGAILGFAPLSEGENLEVTVPIDGTAATETLYAMLHTDAGETGVYEFPDGPDVPVRVNNKVITPPFQVGGETPTAERVPAVVVIDQDRVTGLDAGMVTVPLVFSQGPGWMVIHADGDGGPGPVIGYAALTDGMNLNVAVEIDLATATERLFAMLHTDAGAAGVYEFPGDDGPVKVNDQVVVLPFQGPALSPAPESSSLVTIEISDFNFSPSEVTVFAGTTVVWTLTGDYPHSVTADDGSFDSGGLNKGNSFSFTFTQEGTYPYYCQFHGGPGGQGMSGTITVVP